MLRERQVIIYGVDAAYWTHTFVSLYSLLLNNKDVPFDLRLLSDAADETFFSNIAGLKQLHENVEISWVPVDLRLVAGLPPSISEHISHAVYYKLLIGRLLPTTAGPILFLDSDTIVRGALHNLFTTDVNDCVLAAVPQPRAEYAAKSAAMRLGLPEDAPYFNAGVMRINLDLWRDLDIESKCLAFIQQYPTELSYAEQDALNAIMVGKWRCISSSFNYSYEHVVWRQMSEIGVDPVIVHYTGPGKPWRSPCYHPYRADYWMYRRQTPYADFREYIACHVIRNELLNVGRKISGFVRKMPLGGAIVRNVKKTMSRGA